MCRCVCPLTSYCKKCAHVKSRRRAYQLQLEEELEFFTNQWWTNSGLPASQTSLLLSGAPSAEQAGWAALISSVVVFFFHTGSHRGTCVCVWDAGMHGANPPLSGNAWTVSKTLLLLLLPSMLIRCGLWWGGRVGGCTDVIQGWHHKVHNAPIVRDMMHLADLRRTFKVNTGGVGRWGFHTRQLG